MTEGKESDWKIQYQKNLIERLEDINDQVKKRGKESAVGEFFETIMHACEYTVPQTSPGHPNFRLGKSLGPKYKHWKRVKIAGRLRLFFRYDSSQKIIVYAWINDEKSKRESGGSNDVYKVFEQRLESRKIPNDIEALIRDSGPWSRF